MCERSAEAKDKVVEELATWLTDCWQGAVAEIFKAQAIEAHFEGVADGAQSTDTEQNTEGQKQKMQEMAWPRALAIHLANGYRFKVDLLNGNEEGVLI